MVGITIFLGVLTVIMTVWGGLMAFSSRRNQAIFIGCGVLMILLIIVQTTINDRDLRTRDDKIDIMNGSLENMKGQLIAFRELMTSFLSSSIEPAPKQLSQKRPKNIRGLSNTELYNRVIRLANNMHDFETNFKKEEQKFYFRPSPSGTKEEKNKQWQMQINTSIQRGLEYRNEFQKRFLAEAINYRDELLRRLNIIPPKEEKEIIALKGFLAGPNPVSALATYLKKMASQLSN